MHPNPVYRGMPKETNQAYARERGFGVLSTNGDFGPLLAHVPFLLSDDGQYADLHLVRSNAIVRAISAPVPAVIAVLGPDSYISPDWYEASDMVPTWNYVAVQLRGTLRRLEQDELPDLLDRLSAHFEQQLAPKPIWTSAKMSEDVLERMLRQIVPFRLDITQTEGTWKLAQNKPDSVRMAASRQVKARGIGQECAVLSALMMAPNGE